MTLIYFALVLGITVFVHELGHFIFAKKAGVYVYEFAIGMGPIIWKHKRKGDDTLYTLRLLPIGGFVAMAGEDMEEENAPKDKQLINRPWINRFLTMIAGVLFNFLFAFILLFIIGMINGVPTNKSIIGGIEEGYPFDQTQVSVGDQIIRYNGKKLPTTDKLTLLVTLDQGKEGVFTLRKEDGTTYDLTVKPKEVTEGKQTGYKYGFSLQDQKRYGIIPSIEYAFTKVASLVDQMVLIVWNLITGNLSLSNLSGPVGIYTIVDQTRKAGLINVIYLVAYLCINVGFINLLPLPAFDGGRAFFLIIEKIRGKKMNPATENKIHTIGFYLLMALMLLITYNDIIRLIKR